MISFKSYQSCFSFVPVIKTNILNAQFLCVQNHASQTFVDASFKADSMTLACKFDYFNVGSLVNVYLTLIACDAFGEFWP